MAAYAWQCTGGCAVPDVLFEVTPEGGPCEEKGGLRGEKVVEEYCCSLEDTGGDNWVYWLCCSREQLL